MEAQAFCCLLSILGPIAAFVFWLLKNDSRSSRLSELDSSLSTLALRVSALETSLLRVEQRLVQQTHSAQTQMRVVQTHAEQGPFTISTAETQTPEAAQTAFGQLGENPPQAPAPVAALPQIVVAPAAYDAAQLGVERPAIEAPSSAQMPIESTPIYEASNAIPPLHETPSSHSIPSAEPKMTDAPAQAPHAAYAPAAQDAAYTTNATNDSYVQNATAPAWQTRAPEPENGFSWEEWLGVKGAAAFGSIVLVVAAFYLFRYGVEHDWFNFTPAFRVAAALLFGVGCIAASVPLRKRDQALLGDWLTGAGIAILYASIWAARALYDLVGTGASGVGLAVVTITCGVLATRRNAIVIAALGLVGGFVTPLLLSTGVDRPIGLFSYLFLLCVGVGFVARHKARENPAWNGLMVAALAFLGVYQLGWLVTNMDAHEVVIGSVVTFAFAGLFVSYGAELKKRVPDSIAATLLLVGSIGLLILSTFVFAVNAEVVLDVWPTAILVLPMLVLVEWIANREEVPYYSLPATFVAVTALTTALLCREAGSTTFAMLQSLAPLFAVFLISHATTEWQARVRDEASRISGLGVYMVPVAFWILLSAHRILAPAFFIAMFAMIFFGLRASYLFAQREALDDESDPSWILGSHVFLRAGATAAFAVVFTLLSSGMLPGHRLTWFSLATVLPFAFASLVPVLRPMLTRVAIWTVGSWMIFAPTVLAAQIESALWLSLLLLIGFALAFRGRSGSSVAVIGVLFALMFSVLVHKEGWGTATPFGSEFPFVLALGATLFFYLLPSIFLPRVLARSESSAWNSPPSLLLSGTVVSLVVLLWNLLASYNFAFGKRGLGLLAAATALPALLVYWSQRKSLPELWRKGLAVRFIGLGLCLVVAAIPLELQRQWITVGWALQAAALIWLFTRFQSRALLFLAGGLFATITVRLVMNPYLLEYEQRGLPVLNWLLYTYMIPAAAMGFAAVCLTRWQERAIEAGSEVVEGILTLRNLMVGAMFLLGFVWVNLTIFDAFGTQRFVSITIERHATRDVVLSIAWGLYAIMLLAIGIWKKASALRWASLALVYLSIFKMFLYDLGNVPGLFRVLSLLGLAASLLAVAFVYRKFVFTASSTNKAGSV